MARDNYFVVVYKILNYLLECFMTGEQPREEAFGPEELGINYGYWRNVIESIMDEGYVTGVVMVKRMNAEPAMRLDHIKITQKGINFCKTTAKCKRPKSLSKRSRTPCPVYKTALVNDPCAAIKARCESTVLFHALVRAAFVFPAARP